MEITKVTVARGKATPICSHDDQRWTAGPSCMLTNTRVLVCGHNYHKHYLPLEVWSRGASPGHRPIRYHAEGVTRYGCKSRATIVISQGNFAMISTVPICLPAKLTLFYFSMLQTLMGGVCHVPDQWTSFNTPSLVGMSRVHVWSLVALITIVRTPRILLSGSTNGRQLIAYLWPDNR